MENKKKLYVVSHTHWDREWYQTFQQYRKRLVFMLDELIEHMQKDPEYKFFHLDGQTIVLEDYLAIRPENEGILKQLIKEGRIIIGPWYVMPDEFLISGESLIRNLQEGHRICSEYGVKPMNNGYVIDIFGHNSQFPQIMKGFGIDSATLFRGIGDYEKDTFVWEGKDGSKVLCLKIDKDRSYSNFYFGIRWPFENKEYEKDELVSKMKDLLERFIPMAVSDNLLMMDGVDHIEIEPELSKILKMLRENMDDIEIEQTTLEEYIKAQKNASPALDTINGELYNTGKIGLNNSLLQNVLSSMVHLKQMNQECETLLTKWAEPLEAFGSFHNQKNMQGFMNEAWRMLIQNHPHDSICGCSVSRVHKDNEYRFAQVKDIGEEIFSHQAKDLVSNINTSVHQKKNSLVLFNTSQIEFSGVLEANIEFPVGVQGSYKYFNIHLNNADGEEIPYQVIDAKKNTITPVYEFRRLPEFPTKDIIRIAFEANIPAMGYTVYGYEDYRIDNPLHGEYSLKEWQLPTRFMGSMQTDYATWENEYLSVKVNHNGSLRVQNKATGKVYEDLLIFEDCPDVGDGWVYRRPIKESKYLSICNSADVSIQNDGPFEVTFKIVNTLNLPSSSDNDNVGRNKETAPLKITTLVTMKKGSARLEFKTILDNNIGEHRLRVLFPNHMDTDNFYTSTPFSIEKRNIKRLERNDYREYDTGVFPNQGFVFLKDMQNSICLMNKGLYEVEIFEDKSKTIALTLLRSFKNEMGKDIGEMSFMKKHLEFEFALEFGSKDTNKTQAFIGAEAWRSGIRGVCCESKNGQLEPNSSYLKVNISGAVLTAFKNEGESLKVIRLFNAEDYDISGNIELYKEPKKVFLLDLNENVIEEISFDKNKIVVSIGANKIHSIGVEF